MIFIPYLAYNKRPPLHKISDEKLRYNSALCSLWWTEWVARLYIFCLSLYVYCLDGCSGGFDWYTAWSVLAYHSKSTHYTPLRQIHVSPPSTSVSSHDILSLEGKECETTQGRVPATCPTRPDHWQNSSKQVLIPTNVGFLSIWHPSPTVVLFSRLSLTSHTTIALLKIYGFTFPLYCT